MHLNQCKIVLVGTTHPGNIGAAARAMRTMSFRQLSLVEPQCPIGEIAYARASGANDVLDNRETHDSLQQAISDCHYVFATSARRRALRWPELDPVQLAAKISALEDDCRVALVFGREHSGLRNDELQLCHYMVNIPADPIFSSLNLAAAVQLLCYELYRCSLSTTAPSLSDARERSASSAELEDFFDHFASVIEAIEFLDPTQPGAIMPRLRRLYLRAEPSHKEINILRGILAAMEKRLR